MLEDVQSEGKTWNFMGIYAKNRKEWILSDLATATLGGTVVAFYDTLGPKAIEFVIEQTNLTSITCSADKISKLILLKTQGKADSLKYLVSMDSFDESQIKDA